MSPGDTNPSHQGAWTDGSGQVWHRKGKRSHRLSPPRVQTLLRRADVPLVVWRSFETEQYLHPDAKAAAVDGLIRLADSAEDLEAHEWTTEDGRVLLMIEHHC